MPRTAVTGRTDAERGEVNMRASRVTEAGSALVYAVFVTAFVLAVSAVVLDASTSSRRVSLSAVARAQLRGLAESGVASAHHRLWTRYLAERPDGKARNVQSYRSWLDSLPTVTADATAVVESAAAPSGETLEVQATRRDVGTTETYLTLVSTAASPAAAGASGERVRIETVLKVAGKPFDSSASDSSRTT
jgi:hypothetical protein